jgi:hypothetical protein
VSMSSPSHKQALHHLLERSMGSAHSDVFKDKLVDEILRINDHFTASPSRDEALNFGERVDRHVSSVINDAESFRRGGSTRTAACTCGWIGPQRSTMASAADDAIEHERSPDPVVGLLPIQIDWNYRP